MTENIPQLATARILCNGNIGTVVIFFPSQEDDYVYILSAKHCLTGKNFDQQYRKEDIVLDKIFNSRDSTYHTYTLTETDIVIISGDCEDVALLILPKQRIVELTGKEFFYSVADTDVQIKDYEIRGFANFNDQQTDRLLPLKFIENQKDNNNLFTLKSEEVLDTYYQQALDNVEGMSGCGAFALLNGSVYLTGIIHSYENANLFTATKVIVFNQLIPAGKFKLIHPVKPETNAAILDSYTEMNKNEASANARIRDTVGTLNIPREMKPLIHAVNTSQIIVVHGKPGVGKSALAKAMITEVKAINGTTIVTFTAEQLYCETLTEAFQKAGYKASLNQIIGSPLSGRRVLIWIESFEKLVESGFEGAFNELLVLVRKYQQLSVIITIRDYLLQKFKITYHYELPENIFYHQVDAFNEEEIARVSKAIPAIKPLLNNAKIHHLLRTPYYLDKAARIIPQLLKEDQLDEAQFQKLMWEHIVEAGDKKRGEAFSVICLNRAREMSLYTASKEPQDILNRLVGDNILKVEQVELTNYYSPSHDILEDWVLVRYIKQQKRNATDGRNFLSVLENGPAIKRAFRLWLDEYYRMEPETSAGFVHSLLLDDELSQSWKDELIIASLRSDHAQVLFNALKPQLLANNGTMLRRVIKLLETGCKTINPQSRDFDELLPVGSGWDFIIDFIKDNIAVLPLDTFEFRYLSVIEAWSKQLPDFDPGNLPPSSRNAAILLKDFIQRRQDTISGYSRRRGDSSFLKRYTTILFKLTAAAPEIVKDLMDAALNSANESTIWTNKETLESVRGYITDGVMADQLCKYFPDDVIRAASEDWRKKEKVKRPGSIFDMIVPEPDFRDFGLNEYLDREYGVPSGYQTFFYWMFLHHPDKALDFLIPFLNGAFEKNQHVLSSLSEGVEEVSIQFKDGTDKTYFGHHTYWVMFRGIDSRNRLITSLLMALESGLLDLADKGEMNYPVIQIYLRRLIKESNNVAFLGIVSSVLQAHPALLDETSVSLLGIPLFFSWDSTRFNTEMIDLHVYNDEPFEKLERIKSNQRPHRRKYYLGLVGFVADYMFYYGTLNDLLFKEVDAMWAKAPDGDRRWRKFLFDMDARKYEFKPITQPGYEKMVQLVPGYDEDTKQMVFSGGSDFMPTANVVWAKKAFDGEEMPDNNYETWKAGYKYLLNTQDQNGFMTSPGTMAILGLRDFSEKLTIEEYTWCQEELIRIGEKHLQKRDAFDIDFGIMDTNPAMLGLSYIFRNETINSEIQKKAKEVIFRLLISRMDEQPKIYLEAGISQHLSRFQPAFAINCWWGVLLHISNEQARERSRNTGFPLDWDDGTDSDVSDQQTTGEENWQDQLVQSVVNGTIQPPGDFRRTLDMATHWFLNDALRIIPTSTSSTAQKAFIQQVFDLHVAFLGNANRKDRTDFYDSRNAFTFFYPRYLLNLPQEEARKLFIELLDLILPKNGVACSDDLGEFVYGLVKGFILAVNSGSAVENFWELWECLREWMLSQKNGFFMPLFLMDLDWTESSEGWWVLNGKNLYYKTFIVDWGFNQINTSIKFLTGIAFNKFMPDSVSWITSLLQSQNASQVDMKMLEKFTEKAFYKYGNKVKSDKPLLDDFLLILDFLISRGSSKAYMLKEELITYK
ncbi:MAG TPA: hypothetical protein VF421_06445 [Niabella sp.]